MGITRLKKIRGKRKKHNNESSSTTDAQVIWPFRSLKGDSSMNNSIRLILRKTAELFSFVLPLKNPATATILFLAFFGLPLLASHLNHPLIQTMIPRAFKIVASGLTLFFIPGLLLIPLIKLRYRNLFELFGLSFVCSLGFSTILLLVGIGFKTSMQSVAVGFIFLVLALFAGVLFTHTKEIDILFSAKVLPQIWRHDLFLLLLIVFSTFPAYRWGTDIFLNHGEILLHLAYTVNYATSDLCFMNLGFAKGTPLPNLINLWEALLALWANLIQADPYEIFFFSRFIATLIGLIGLMWMIRCIFGSSQKTFILSLASLLLVFSWFFLMTPSPWEWIRSQQSRGIFCFYPLAGHSDTAIDVLIPIGCSILLYNLRYRRPIVHILFFIFSVSTFLWHPREFFQFCLYAFLGWFTFVVLFTSQFVKTTKRFLCIFAPLILTAALFYLFNHFFANSETHSYDEFSIKKTALVAAFSPIHLLGYSHFFNFPNDWIPFQVATAENPRFIQSFPWLICSAFSLIFIIAAADFRSKFFGLFFFFLWFFCFIWSSGTLLCIAFSYSEFIMTSPRIIYFFSYLIIPLGFLSLFDWLNSLRLLSSTRFISTLCLPVSLLGLFLGRLWPRFYKVPYESLFVYLSYIIVFCYILFLFKRSRSFVLLKIKRHSPIYPLVLFVLFFSTFNYSGLFQIFKEALSKKSVMYSLEGANNPFGFSSDLISTLKSLPSHRAFLVNPAGIDSVNVYGAFYLSVFPHGVYQSINRDVNICKQFIEGTHALNRLFQGKVSDTQALEWLTSHDVDFVLFRGEDYDHVLPSISTLSVPPYSVIFFNTRDREMICSFKKEN